MIDENRVDRMDCVNVSIIKPMNKSIATNTTMIVRNCYVSFSDNANLTERKDPKILIALNKIKSGSKKNF